MYNPILGYEPSEYQEKAFQWFSNPQDNRVLKAVAGSGKSTTLIDGVRFVPGMKTLAVAFTREVSDNLAAKFQANGMGHATAKGMHQLGFQMMRENFPHIKFWQIDKGWKNKYKEMVWEHPAIDHNFGDSGANIYQIRQAIYSLVNMAQLSCTQPRVVDLLEMAERFSLTLPFDIEEAQPIVRQIIIDGVKSATKDGRLAFNDMIYVPVMLQLPYSESYDLVVADEIQDFNMMQRKLVMQVMGDDTKFMGVGDPNQSIYYFAGAEPDSFDRIRDTTKAMEMPLSICYRCPLAVIEEAKQYVPDIQAAPNAIEGESTTITEEEFWSMVEPQDLIICRMTAPLVKACLDLIRQGKSAKVKGKDIGDRLCDIVDNVESMSEFSSFRSDFIPCLDHWRVVQIDKISRRKYNVDAQVDAINDLYDCLVELAKSASDIVTADGFKTKIKSLFADTSKQILLSTVHKIKGGQARRVFIIAPEKLPYYKSTMTEVMEQQEKNLAYVAITRAQEKLYRVASRERGTK